MNPARFDRLFAIPLLAGGLAFGQTASIDFTALQQEIDGFGAASVGGGLMNTKELDAAFLNNTQNQIGLSIDRVEVTAWGTESWEVERKNAQGAKARGAKYVFASIWSGPASMKTNNNVAQGSLKESSYADYAAYLKSFREFMGPSLDIISIQNEPNVKVDYISCDWTPTQLYNFTKNHAAAIGGDVMMPETFNFDVAYSDPVLNDPVAAKNITHIGVHLYGAQMKTYTNAVNKGKKIWMTEHFYNGDDIGTVLTGAKEIMDCLNNRMNAYVWWYLRVPSCNLIDSNGVLNRKGYMMGQFAKYVRPGSYRATATYSPQAGVTVMAFAGTKNVIIAINQNTSTKSQSFSITKGTFATPKRYTTSNTKRLADDGTVAVNNGAFTTSLDAQSITTFVPEGTSGITPAAKTPKGVASSGLQIRAQGGRLFLADSRGRAILSTDR
ncbi:MAG: glucuronoxylanase XynC [Fibrobacterota bacterium]|nr:MAG: glucuronoxylanase XynC [Fibrobacterota bacterium]